MAPVVHGLEKEYFGEIGFAYLDVDDPAVMPFEEMLGFRVQPHLLLLDSDGNIVEQWVGVTSGEILAAAFDGILAGETAQ
jgi:hypothetical protein